MNENKKVSTIGIILKSILGIIIVFTVAMPKILTGEILFSGIMGFISVIILGILWYALFRALMVNRGTIINLVLYMLTCGLLGLFFSNTISISIYYVNFFSDGAVDPNLVNQALIITAFATMIAVIGGVMMLPKIKLDGKTAKIGRNMLAVLSAVSLGWIVLFVIGLVLSLFGATWLLNGIYNMMFGVGFFSIGISILMVLFAEILFLSSAARVKTMIGTEDKYLEYFGAMVLVNAVIQIFGEIFKLVLKILASKNKD
ncbi:MAG: hypothetical protein ACRC5R_04760 [Mycoplasmatales bacterium]